MPPQRRRFPTAGEREASDVGSRTALQHGKLDVSRDLAMIKPAAATRLVDAIRKAAAAGIWSAGVKLARASAAAIESEDAEEMVLRVRAPGRPVAPTVVLYPGELDWDCDCAGRVRPCDHIVAAALTLAEGGGDAGGVP